MTILSEAIVLLLIMDPFGNIPVFLAVLKNISESRRKRVIFREMVLALGILIIFLFFGHSILNFLAIKEFALSIAGGTVLFIISLKLIFKSADELVDKSLGQEEPFIVPLATPLIAGPSTIAMVLLLAAKESEIVGGKILAVVIAWALTIVFLLIGNKLSKFLGHKGLRAIEKLMGMILVILSVQMFLNGLQEFLAIAKS